MRSRKLEQGSENVKDIDSISASLTMTWVVAIGAWLVIILILFTGSPFQNTNEVNDGGIWQCTEWKETCNATLSKEVVFKDCNGTTTGGFGTTHCITPEKTCIRQVWTREVEK